MRTHEAIYDTTCAACNRPIKRGMKCVATERDLYCSGACAIDAEGETDANK